MESTITTEQIDTSTPSITPTLVDTISTTSLLSVELSTLLPLITDNLANSEDQTYLSIAIQLTKEAKDF